MVAKFLQGLGLLALLGLVAGSIAALALVKQRVHVTIAEDSAASRGPDPLELVRADLGALRADLGGLGAGLGQGLEQLHGELELVQTTLAALEARSERASSGGGGPAAPAASAPVPRADADAATSSAPRKSFLSFQLPSDAFDFERTLRLEIVPSLSRVGFDATSTLHDFSGTTSEVAGELTACLARPTEGCRGEIRVQAAALATGEAERDAEMRKSLDVAAAPSLRFVWEAFTLEALDAGAQRLTGTARGQLTIRGTTRPFALPVRVSVDTSSRVVVEGEGPLSLADFGVETPSKLGLIKVADEVRIWIALRARSLGAVPAGSAGPPATVEPDRR